ncbi:unnamed protein product [Lactuca virosa]|uniref:Uncharacterized protein n=1 Tax=Lactuca virosa TaxID=75947 RepID=A0AAU9P267_9ASTR|nr:unnamed protein product [Lactuca virosa]
MINVACGSSGLVTLFVEIINNYLYYFEKGNPQITSVAIQGLIELIKTEMQSDTETLDQHTDAFFTCTLRFSGQPRKLTLRESFQQEHQAQ